MATHKPATPEEKLYTRMAQAETQGKEFDEAKERRVLGMPMPANRDPVYVPPSAERASLADREDREETRRLNERLETAKAALADEANRANASDLQQQLQAAQSRIDELEKKLGYGESVVEAPAPGHSLEDVDGPPDEGWTKQSIIAWGHARGIPFPGNGVPLTKAALLEIIHQHIDESGAVVAGAEEEASG